MAAHKTFFITGSTDGIGLHTAKRLASLATGPAAIILHGRDRARLDRAAEQVEQAAAAARPATTPSRGAAVAVRTHLCDLASGDVRALAEAVARDAAELALPLTVVHNAGVYAVGRGGREMVGSSAAAGAAPGGGQGPPRERTWATNVLAPFALQHELLRALGWRRAPSSSSPEGGGALLEPPAAARCCRLERVVVTSSLSAQQGAIDFDNLEGQVRWSPHGAYSLSKACNQAFAARLAELLSPASGGGGGGHGDEAVGVFSLDPGTVNTKMLLDGWGEIGVPVAEADDTLWLAAAPREALGATGGYFVGRRRARLVAAAADGATVDRLWALWREQTGCDELF